MDRLQHHVNSLHLAAWGDGEDVAVEMYRAPLVTGIRERFWYGLQHAQVLIADDKTHSYKAALFEPYKERTPAFTVVFHAFSCTDDLTAAIIADTDCNENGDILDFSAPAAFQVDSIYINIRIFTDEGACAPGFNMLISLFVEVADSSWRNFGSS